MKTFIAASALTAATVFSLSAPAHAQLRLPGLSGGASGDTLTVDLQRGVLTLAPLLERTTPAVVNIAVTSTVKAKSNSPMNDEFFKRFFENGQGERQEPQERQASSAGSGVIIDARKGYVLTNAHVIKNADEVSVTLKDSRSVIATVLGSDPKTDIALLQIDTKNLTALTIADSDDTKVGDYVLAIGNPFGLGQTVTSGIVSALGRAGISRDGYEDFIQTDASINPGNSGGALINSKGELIGINTAIISRSGSSAGIGFAVPANMALKVVDQLSRYGEVRRGRIGVGIQDLSADLREALDIAADAGALVRQVEEDSPADRAGLEVGDVIIAFDGEPITSSRDIRNAVGFVERGTRHDITYLRDGKRIKTKIDVEQAPESDADTDADEADNDNVIDDREGFNGASISAIPEGLDPSDGNDGVYVASIRIGSKAARAGLQKGDVIRQVNRKSVKGMSDFKREIDDNEGVIALTVQRGRSKIFIAVK